MTVMGNGLPETLTVRLAFPRYTDLTVQELTRCVDDEPADATRHVACKSPQPLS